MEREKVSLLIFYLSLPYRFSWFRHVIHTGSLAAPAPEDTTLLRTIPPSNKNSDRIFPAAGKRTTYYLKNFLMQYTMGRLQISTACPERAELSKSTESVADLLLRTRISESMAHRSMACVLSNAIGSKEQLPSSSWTSSEGNNQQPK